MTRHILSLEERIGCLRRTLMLIHAAANAPDDIVDADAVSEAMGQAAIDGLALLEPLVHVPAAIANWTPKGGGR